MCRKNTNNLNFRWVKTENGQKFADAVGVAEPPMTVKETAEKVLGLVSLYLPCHLQPLIAVD